MRERQAGEYGAEKRDRDRKKRDRDRKKRDRERDRDLLCHTT